MMSTGTIMDLSEFKSTQLKLLLSSIERTVEKVSQGVTIEELCQILEKTEELKGKHKKINKMHLVLKQNILARSMAKINQLVVEDNLDEQFIKLKEIIDNNDTSCSSDQGNNVWRPPRNVYDHVRSHLVKVKLEMKSNLELYVEEQEESVKNLMSAIKTVRDNDALELEKRMSELTDKVQDMNRKMEEVVQSFRDDFSE